MGTQLDLDSFAAWLRDDHDRSELTIRAYNADVRAFVAWMEETSGKTFQLSDVTPTDSKDYRARLTRNKQKASSINRRLSALRAFFKWAVQHDLIARNPLNGVKSLRQQETAPRWLDPRAEHRLQQAVEKHAQETDQRRGLRDSAMLTLMWKAGLRVGEVAALDLADVKIQSGKRGIVQVRQGKGRKARSIPMNAGVAQAVSDWLKARGRVSPRARAAEGGTKRGETEGDKPLFTNKSNRRITPRAIQQMTEQIGRQAAALVRPRSSADREIADSLNSLSPHVLRHTCAKRLMDAGATLTEVAEILGHENLNTTRIYTQPSSADLQRAVDRISSAE